MEKRIEEYDVVIIGGGPAGLTAGIYCGRARLKTLIIEKSLIGGLATYTSEIENYPGYPEGTSGMDLTSDFHKQAKNYGVKFKLTDVRSVEDKGDIKVVETFRTDYHAKCVIVCTGGKPRLTGAIDEDLYLYDKGISFCATCDAAANTDKTVLVVGSGDAAIEEGMFLTKFAKEVIVSVIHDEGIMDCNEIAKNQALNNPKMSFLWNTGVKRYEGDERLHTVVLENIRTKEEVPVTVDSCFLFIGYLPNTDIFENMLTMTSQGYLKVNEHMETNIPGIFAAGDVCDKTIRQVATAVGDGAIAGCSVEKYLAESEVFEKQILNDGKKTLVYLYDGSDAKQREHLSFIEELENDVDVVRVDVYKSKGLARRLHVEQFPTIVIMNNNNVETRIDSISKESVKNYL